MAQRRKKTKDESNQRNRKPNVPRALPKMVIDQCPRDASRQTNPEPHGVFTHVKINVALAVAGESAGTEKDHNPDREQSEDSEKQDVGALPVH